jgi:hypothetical protein
MLTSYMDESGHSSDPVSHYAAMAGFVGEFEILSVAGEVWDRVIRHEPFCLKGAFHMKDFAHFAGEFEGWSEDKRRSLFGHLVEILTLISPAIVPVGVVVSVEDFNSLEEDQRKAFQDPYYMAFQLCTRGAAIVGIGDKPEKVAMVYSYNQERGAIQSPESYSVNQFGMAEKLWHEMKRLTTYGQWMGAYSSSTPGELAQLQMADLFAYELTKEFENLRARPNDAMRWGLRQILGHANPETALLRLLDRREMLRIIKENQFPCQTGTQEVEDVDAQMEFSRRQTAEWIRKRVVNDGDEGIRQRRIQSVRQVDGEIAKGSPQRDQGQTGSGEGGEGKAEG